MLTSCGLAAACDMRTSPSRRLLVTMLCVTSAQLVSGRCVAQARVTVPKSTIAGHLRTAGPGEMLRVVKRAGVDTLMVTADSSAAIRVGDVLVVPTGSRATIDTVAGNHVDLPNRYVQADVTGQQLLTLSLRVAITGGGLRYDSSSQAFVGSVLVGLEDSMRPLERLSLSQPIPLQVTGDAEVVDPESFQLTHTNVPFASIRIRARPASDTVRLLIQPTFDPMGVPTPIPVMRPRIDLHASPEAVSAFGLQPATLTINAPALAGSAVVISSNRGSLDRDTLTLSDHGIAVTRIRSGAPGMARVRVAVGQIATGATVINFAIPWTFAVASLLGGLVGALIRGRLRNHRGARGVRTDLLLGLASGTLAAAAYTLGLNLTGFELDVRVGDAATFVVSALGAALDVPGLGRVRKALGS